MPTSTRGEQEAKLRILVLSNLYPPYVLGGYEIACHSVTRGLRAIGHDVEVLAAHAPFATPDDPAWVHRALSMRAYDAVEPHTADLADAKCYEAGASQYPNTSTLLSHLRRFRPDVVYVWNLWGIGGLALLDLLEQVGIAWVMHLMDSVPTYLLNNVAPISASLFARHDASLFRRGRAIAMSEHVLAEIESTCGVRFDHAPTIVPGWVNPVGLGQRSHYREGGMLRLVTAGSIQEIKGTRLIVEACARLVSEGKIDFYIDIYGFGSAEAYVQLAAQLGVSSHVRFLGPRTHDEILALLPEYDVFLFPTHAREPFGFAPIEAAACGVAPIITRNAGCAERLVDEVHALKIDRTAQSLACAIDRFLTGECDVAAMGKRAARMVRSDMNFDRCLSTVEQVLSEAVRPTDFRELDDQRLPRVLFAKHTLGQYLTARR